MYANTGIKKKYLMCQKTAFAMHHLNNLILALAGKVKRGGLQQDRKREQKERGTNREENRGNFQ